MYVCMYVCMHVMYVCMFVCMYVYLYTLSIYLFIYLSFYIKYIYLSIFMRMKTQNDFLTYKTEISNKLNLNCSQPIVGAWGGDLVKGRGIHMHPLEGYHSYVNAMLMVSQYFGTGNSVYRIIIENIHYIWDSSKDNFSISQYELHFRKRGERGQRSYA